MEPPPEFFEALEKYYSNDLSSAKEVLKGDDAYSKSLLALILTRVDDSPEGDKMVEDLIGSIDTSGNDIALMFCVMAHEYSLRLRKAKGLLLKRFGKPEPEPEAEAPETLETPETPETSDETPSAETPETPETPETSDETPSAETPAETPETPETPETAPESLVPETPETVVPETPETVVPEAPESVVPVPEAPESVVPVPEAPESVVPVPENKTLNKKTNTNNKLSNKVNNPNANPNANANRKNINITPKKLRKQRAGRTKKLSSRSA